MKWCIQANWIVPSVVYVVLGLRGRLSLLLTCSHNGGYNVSVLLRSHASKDINTSAKLPLNYEILKHYEFAAISQCPNSRSRHGIITLLAVQIGETSICVCHYKYNMLIQILPFAIWNTSFYIFLFPPHNTAAMLEVCASGPGQKPVLSHIFADSHGIKQHRAYSRKWSKQKSNLPLWINIILPSEAHPSKITCLLNTAAWHTYARACTHTKQKLLLMSAYAHAHTHAHTHTRARVHVWAGWKISLGHDRNADRQPCVKMPIHPSIHPYTYPTIHLFIRPSVCQFVYRSIDPPQSICLLIHPSNLVEN